MPKVFGSVCFLKEVGKDKAVQLVMSRCMCVELRRNAAADSKGV